MICLDAVCIEDRPEDATLSTKRIISQASEDGEEQQSFEFWQTLGHTAEQLAGALRSPGKGKAARPSGPAESAHREDRAGWGTPPDARPWAAKDKERARIVPARYGNRHVVRKRD